MNSLLKEILQTGAKELGLSIGEKETALFLKYLSELKEWNKKINLTAITDDRDIVIRHFLDSLTPASFLAHQKTLLDIGSGAGFPGIPLKIVLPDLKVTLMDSVNKKIIFMKHIIRTLGLEQIEAVHARGEDGAVIKRFAASFDVVTSRAFSGLKEFLNIARPYIKDKGIILVVKGPKGIKELKDIDEMKCLNLIEKRDVKLPFSDIITTIFVFKKETEVIC